MPEAFEQLKNNLSRFMTNPSALLRTCVDNVEAGYNGNISINDPTNPFISLLEMSAAVAVSNIEKLRGACKELYPKLAIEAPELWRHMSDDDFLDPFSRPSTAPFTLLLGYQEIISKAVYDPNTFYKKLVIPKHTRIVVNDTPFTFQYPIEIRVLEHGGITTVYNTDKASPILELESNVVKSFKTRIDGTDLLAIEFNVEQINIATRNNIALTSSTGFNKIYNYVDKYYYTRAFVETNPNVWTEIGVTLSDQVFDPLKLTLVAKVYNGTVEYMIPATYFMNGIADNKNLRIWTYTTKGDYSANLAEIVPNSFSYEFVDYEDDDNGIYSKPLNTFRTIAIYSPGSCSGGSNAISLDELRNRVIDNAIGMPKLPITDDQLIVEWNDIAFDIVKSIDNITDRQYIITRDIPDIKTALQPLMDIDLLNNPAISPLSLNVRTFNFNVEELVDYKTVYDNGSRVTILPKTLFMETDGIVSIVDDTIRESFDLMTPLVKANTANANKYSYSPFHYVLYPYENTFEAKPFWLSNPFIKRKVFIDENDKLGLATSVKSYSLEKTDQGYRLLVVTGSNTAFKEQVKINPNSIVAQLSFIPYGSTRRTFISSYNPAYPILGTNPDVKQVDPILFYGNDQTIVPEGELLFQFDIRITEVVSEITKGIDIDDKDNLVIKNFSMSDTIPRDYTSMLTDNFDIIFIDTLAQPTSASSPIDDDTADWLLPGGNNRGIIREQFNIKFGSPLEKLWRKSRTIINEESYEKYPADVYAYYTEDVYERDSNGVLTFEVIPTTVISNAFDASVGDFPTAGTILRGDTWVVSVGGTIDGVVLAIGSKITALVDNPTDFWNDAGIAQWGLSAIVFNKLHSIGDPILDEFNDPIILYQEGDIFRTDTGLPDGNPDANGIPVLKDARRINRLADLCLFEGIYYFADESSSTLYAKTVPDLISTWVNESIVGLNSQFLEQTYAIFYPKTSYGSIQVFVEDTGLVSMRAEQSFFFTVLVKKKVFDDPKIRLSIQQDIISIVDAALKNPVVSELYIMNQVELKLGGLIEGFKMTLFGDNKDINTFTLKDVTNYLNISKRLEVLPDGHITVQDNVDFEFILHDYSTNV